MAFAYAFWGFAALSAAGLVVDVRALRQGRSRALAIAAIVLKSVVAAAGLAWTLYFPVLGLPAGDWADLALFAAILVLGTPLLGIALVCDAVLLTQGRRGTR